MQYGQLVGQRRKKFPLFFSSAGHEVKLTHNTGKSGDLSPSMHQLMDRHIQRAIPYRLLICFNLATVASHFAT